MPDSRIPPVGDNRDGAPGIDAGSRLDVRLLGPLDVVLDGESLGLARRPRTLLAALALRAGEVISSGALIEILWDGAAPASASSALRIHVSHLRSVLPPGLLVTERSGYRLQLSPSELDAARFEELLAEGRRALAVGDAREARSRYLRALALWRGDALSDLNSLQFARDASSRLDELRRSCREERFEAELQLGRHSELIADLELLVAEWPLRERARWLLMLALYRAGRQADALACYQAGRASLVATLGIEPGPELRELERSILTHDPVLAAPAATGGSRRRRVPGPHTRTLGRDRVIADLREQLLDPRVRLVTLVGPGGIGKTRLAVELAAALEDDLADGAVLVDLAPLAEPTQLLPSIGRALGLREGDATGWDVLLGEHLGRLELLLVLDNFEHLVDGAAAIAPLLDASPLLTVLATSRRVLRLSAERVVDVQPLDALASRQLLVSRAAASGVTVDVDGRAVADIAARLDGLPLAIELAAPWFRRLSSEALLERLHSRLATLDDGPRDAPERHRTMRSAIDWSFGMLDGPAQALLGRVSLFRGRFTTAAMVEVAGTATPVDDLAALVEASLVQPSGDGHTLLEVVREYGRELPSADAEGHELHAGYQLRLAEEAEPELAGADQGLWLERLEDGHDDLRAALTWFEGSGQPAQALRLAGALGRFWYIRGYLSEGLDHLQRILAADSRQDPALTAKALRTASALAVLRGDYPQARAAAEEAFELYRGLGDVPGSVRSLSNLGAILHAQGELDAAAATLERCIVAAEELGEPRLVALARNNRGDVALSQGQLEVAARQFELSLALLREANDLANVARSLYNLGVVAVSQGALDRASGLLVEALDLSNSVDDKEDVAWCLLALAAVAARTGRPRESATLLGFGQAFVDRLGASLKPFERRLYDDTLARLGDARSRSELNELLAAGAGIGDAEAIRLAESIGASADEARPEPPAPAA